MSKFKLVSKFKPNGDQPAAIKGLVSGLQERMRKQTLLGVTGSGKTFTVANVIEQVQMPTLVIAPNKTLAAQLCNEFQGFFPDNAVEYFVSYYDYYQPEAYLPHSDTYIEKEAQINEEIDRLRHACTQALLRRRDVIIVASVSCIYGLGSPTEYEKIVLHLKKGDKLDRRGLMEQLIEMQFERTNADLKRGAFRLRGQVFEIMPAHEERIYRFEVSDHIDRIELLDPVTRSVMASSDASDGPVPVTRRSVGSRYRANIFSDVWFFPAKHYIAGPTGRARALQAIQTELEERLRYFAQKGKILEAERLKRRVNYDLEMIKNIGYCNGIENYSRHFDGRAAGAPSFTLLDYFGQSIHHSPPLPLTGDGTNAPPAKGKLEGERGFLTIIDESHVTVPQIRGMYRGDRARKDTLIEHGFRLPSARDNRPLTFDEFEARVGPVIYVSATPAEYEIRESKQVVEQIVRPTGLVDPEVIVRPVSSAAYPTLNSPFTKGGRVEGRMELSGETNLSQVEDVINRIQDRIEKGERTLVTTLTKKMAEDLNDYLSEQRIKVKYLHSDIHTLERIEIITALRKGEIDVVVGVNLLREGLDLPEVSLVAILDADKEGFLRSETSLIQTIGRAARNVNGQVVLYADEITGSIERALEETSRRRQIQLDYNKKHGITPKTIEKTIRNILEEFGISSLKHGNIKTSKHAKRRDITRLDTLGDARPIAEIIKDKEKKMKKAAKDLQFELAALLRDEIRELKLAI